MKRHLCVTMALVAMLVALFVPTSRAALVPNQVLQIGEANTVTNYAVGKVWQIWIDVFQVMGSNTANVGSSRDFYLSFSSKSDLDAFFQQRLRSAMEMALTNTATPIDRDKPCTFFASCGNNFSTDGASWAYLNHPLVTFAFTKVGNSYQLPSTSDYIPKLSGTMIYRVPGIKWAINETFYRSNGLLANLVDSRTNGAWINIAPYNATGGVNTNYSWLAIKTSYVTDNVTYSNKITLVDTNGMRVVNSLGTVTPQTPVILAPLDMAPYSYTVRFSGGEPGQQLTLQNSTDLKTWVTVGDFQRGYDTQPNVFQYVSSRTALRKFYRVQITAP